MLPREDLLAPISGPSRAGADLRYEPVYDQIKEARREDDDAPQGEWQRARKTADWALVTRLTAEVLATKSKDLQVAAWMTEAQLRRQGIAGLRDGLVLIRSLLEEYWNDLHPALEDGDAELRAAPLDWLGLRLDTAVARIALNTSGHDLFAYRTSRAVGYEKDVENDEARQEARAAAIADGKLTAEEFDQGFESTPKAWYKTLVADLGAALDALRQLDATSRERFGDLAPSFRRLEDALGEVRHVAGQFLKRKLELDPDPVGDVAVDMTAVQDEVAAGGAAPAARGRGSPAGLAAEPLSREDAAERVASAARFLRRQNPRSPAPYLLLRGFRWGELRANGSAPDPKLLEAPPTHVRSQLKGFLLDGRWEDLLEACESLMATSHGRGWLDLQRYTLTACAGLGTEYDHVSSAIRAELRTLLGDIPALAEMMMMDDTPTANAETQAWLRDVILAGGAEPSAALELLRGAASAPGHGATERRADPALEHALAEVRAGRAQKAIQGLMRDVEREKTPRGRFLRQVQIAELMVEGGLQSVARPILEDLVTEIEAHKLDDWEGGELVARPLSLLYRCLADGNGGDEAMMQNLYLRICRLDPVQAIGFAQV
ncbi:MAG TPA: type VI secretion system protein TssA [Gemmatimonadaceae bacterium]|nr:type VI secretion system protein TssA [Gemmatimonadaceae bacterium]